MDFVTSFLPLLSMQAVATLVVRRLPHSAAPTHRHLPLAGRLRVSDVFVGAGRWLRAGEHPARSLLDTPAPLRLAETMAFPMTPQRPRDRSEGIAEPVRGGPTFRQGQRGAVLPMVALSMTTLLGFVGLVVDLGGMYVAKTELQSATDSCALAASAELDGATDALTRATNAGLAVGNLNKVRYQKASVGLVAGDIVFSDSLTGVYSRTAAVATAAYAKCTHASSGVTNYFVQFLGVGNTNSVSAMAVAMRSHAQNTCPLPIGVRARNGTPPNYGFTVGEWITMLYDPTNKATPSEMGWYNLDGSTSASETANEVAGNGYCGSKVGDPVGTPGAKVSVDDEWNARFGIYKNNGDPASSTMRPDFTGYGYTSANWKNASPQNAYAGTPRAGSDATAANFKTKRAAFASYGDTTAVVNDGDKITSLNMKGGYKALATPGTGGQHATLGQNRRVVLVPIVSASKIADYACMLLLQPVSGTSSVQLEFVSNAGALNSPCTGAGVPGGASGPLVPTLVQ